MSGIIQLVGLILGLGTHVLVHKRMRLVVGTRGDADVSTATQYLDGRSSPHRLREIFSEFILGAKEVPATPIVVHIHVHGAPVHA